MIDNYGKYYLYRHIRLDKNEPFYIGIGTKKESKAKIKFNKKFQSIKYIYDRAYSKIRKSSKIWNLITAKTDYKVEILLESDSLSFIKEKEKEFIAFYGRIDKNTGILANMTDGGEGMTGTSRKFTEEQKIKHRNHTSCKKVVKLDSNYEIVEIYLSSREASRKNFISKVCDICNDKCKLKNGFTYRYLNDYIFYKNKENFYIKGSKYIIYENKEWHIHDFCKYIANINKTSYVKIYNRLQKGLSIDESIKLNTKLKPSKYIYIIENVKTGEKTKFKTMIELCNELKEQRPTIWYRIKNKTVKNGFIIKKESLSMLDENKISYIFG
jgi:hypothetical protein